MVQLNWKRPFFISVTGFFLQTSLVQLYGFAYFFKIGYIYETLFYEMNAEILDLPCISNTALIDISHNVVHRSGTVKAR